MILGELAGYVLAVSIASSGPTGARLHNTGQLRAASLGMPMMVILLAALYGLSGAAAVLYFSWAYLGWQHLVTFLIAWLTFGSWVANRKSRSTVWSVFVSSVVLALVAEIILLVAL